MTAPALTLVTSGGWPVSEAPPGYGTPFDVVDAGGMAATLVPSGGYPVTLNTGGGVPAGFSRSTFGSTDFVFNGRPVYDNLPNSKPSVIAS